MPQIALSRPLRNALQSAVMSGRQIAEAAAAEALAPYAVGDAKAPDHLDASGRAFRNRLRAHARQLGDLLAAGKQEIRRLTEEVAYEQWHRILFARFLIENGLLIHPEFETPVSLEYVEDLAKDEGRDPWELASEFASRMLPQIFRPGDPTQELKLPKNRMQELERLVLGLEPDVFKAGDSLGWAYQFWQAKRKDDINASGVKIGKDEIAAVTQLFTEDYMVEFLLHNSLGAWWMANHPDRPLPLEMPYLRFVEIPADGEGGEPRREPAAGRFDGWPKSLKDFKALDPCCGSGHFPVFLLHLLVPMRMALEGLSPAEAVDAVLRENIHALEIDARCVEIAVFSLALAAWTYPGAGGYRPLPSLNVACCGLAITQKESEWLALADGDSRLREGMGALFRAFRDAPMLGSLINPRSAGGDLLGAKFEELEPLLAEALGKERIRSSEEATEAMLTASGLLQAARILADRYHLVITNVPYLARGKQELQLRDFADAFYPEAKNDLANIFLDRALELSHGDSGVVQLVMPQNWLFQATGESQRTALLRERTWCLLARLGSGAFETISGEVVNVILTTMATAGPAIGSVLRGIDCTVRKTATEKASALANDDLLAVPQANLLKNPRAVVTFENLNVSVPRLGNWIEAYQGLVTGDIERFSRGFFELPLNTLRGDWIPLKAPIADAADQGCTDVLLWERGIGSLHEYAEATRSQLHDMHESGNLAWGRRGVAVNRVKNLRAGLYFGEAFHNSVAVAVPKPGYEALLPTIWAYLKSEDFVSEVRKLDSKLSLTNRVLLQLPFDLEKWSKTAEGEGALELSPPICHLPTQWIFHGHPVPSTDPLQVAVARLAGYRWPAELDAKLALADEQRRWVNASAGLLSLADRDGIVCIPPVKGERAAADRLLDLLAAAYGDKWTPGVLDRLLADAGYAGQSLEEWLRSGFFAQHCKLFHDRPFIWHIWDGERNGFSALVNYHQLDKRKLETLTYTYLGGWIDEQKRQQAAGVKGAKQLVDSAVALKDKLEKILEGERPCDIFVRWKPPAAQPMGWEPDLKDGVRVNIRPFMLVGDVGKKGAGILRDKPNVHWNKDRGNDVPSAPWYDLGPKYGEGKGARINAHHTSLDEKKKARGGGA